MDLAKTYSELSPIGKGLLVAAVICFFVALMDRMVLGPILSHLKVMDAEIEAREETVKRNLRILSFKDRIMEEYNEYSQYLDSGVKSQEEIIGSLLRKIENFAKQQNISILNIRPGDMEENPVFQIYQTGLDCEGTLTDLLAFMSMLEESDYLFQIVKYNMVPKSKTGEVIQCSMDIERILITADELPASPTAVSMEPSV